jgi:hypothetical protein
VIGDPRELDRIRDGIDVLRFIGRYVRLKKSGAQYVGPCPFHKDRMPSFVVHPVKKLWKCHGCGLGGDLFAFVQRAEGLDFVRAKQLLANEAGVSLSSSTPAERREWGHRLKAAEAEARELVAWKKALAETLWLYREQVFRAYHRALRHIREYGLDHFAGDVAADVVDWAEELLPLLNRYFDRLREMSYDELLPHFRVRKAAA